MIKVLKSGLFSTIQDLGRFGFGQFGVPQSGAIDLQSAELANTLLGNHKTDAVLEMTMIGPELQFLVDTQIAISGADMSPIINGYSIQNNNIYTIRANSVLKFKSLQTGLRAYLAVKNGFKTTIVLGSRSFYKPITDSESINKGDILEMESYETSNLQIVLYSKLKASSYSSDIIQVYKGPEFDLLPETQKHLLFETTFKVSNLYNRMAYQLSPKFENSLESILTSPVLPGTIQLTPSGQLIILMRDCQTTGGYPRVLQLSESAINLLAQKKERDKIRFELIQF